LPSACWHRIPAPACWRISFFGIETLGVGTFLTAPTAPTALVLVALVALALPAVRASRVDPVRTLREE
jgi:ABC-type lipoprotein release transport system permease subunit